MPWVDKELCTGCRQCVDACFVGAITIEDDIAFIDEDACIRCGICHEVCAENAVRHDGERIPQEVQSNLAWAKSLLTHEYYADDKTKQTQLIDRLKRFFNKNIKVAQKTIEALGVLQETEYSDN